MNWNYRAGDLAIFNTVQSDYRQYDGMDVVVRRRLSEGEADLCETGPMYRVELGTWHLSDGPIPQFDVFEDELTPTAELMFERMVDRYRALGYRMVVFDCPNDASWLCCFDTHGVSADHLPIEAFANERWLRDLHNYASWSGPLSEVEHMDVTDDCDEMTIGYDFTACFPVLQLAEDWRLPAWQTTSDWSRRWQSGSRPMTTSGSARWETDTRCTRS